MKERTYYCDSSVLLRIILKENLPKLDLAVPTKLLVSNLANVEIQRVLQRLYYERKLDQEGFVAANQRARFMQKGLSFIELTTNVLERASQSFPFSVGTLDAIHLASAALYIEDAKVKDLSFCTHDVQLGRSAEAMGMTVLGV
jgi:predicted nucleic acid-binding protein